jgi:hypothetical protein
MKLPQLSLRDLFWLVLVAGFALSSQAGEGDERIWFDILAHAKTITVIVAEPKENEALKGATFKGEAVTRIVKLAAKVGRVYRLEDDVALTIVKPVFMQIEILTFDKRRVLAQLHAGEATFTDNGKTFVASFEKVEDGIKVLKALGAKWPKEPE